MSPNLRVYAVNEGLKLLLAILWLIVNTLMFYYTFMFYYTGPQFYYLHQMLGYGLCISRASAACINLNCSALLLPMCKRMITAVRGVNIFNRRQVRRILDKGRSFHIYCGYLLGVLAVTHCGAHAYNAFYFSKYYNDRYEDLNVAKYADQNPLLMLVTTLAGMTGLLLVLCLIVIIVFAFKPMRKGKHDRFWKTHHLFIAFYGLLLLHGLDGVIKYQSNLDEHQPGCFVAATKSNNGSSDPFVVAEPEPHPEPHAKPNMHFGKSVTGGKMPMLSKKNSMPKANMQSQQDTNAFYNKAMLMPEPPPRVSRDTKNKMQKRTNETKEKFNSGAHFATELVVMPEPLPEGVVHVRHQAVDRNHTKTNASSSDEDNLDVRRIFTKGMWIAVQECDQPPPKFASCSKETWMWISVPVFLYLLERLLRHCRAPADVTTVVGFREHPGDVFELRMRQKNFKAKPGQCIWIRCPSVSRVESHPFTLTSVPCPADQTFGIHVKAVGDWTRELRDTLVQRAEQFPDDVASETEYRSHGVPCKSNREDGCHLFDEFPVSIGTSNSPVSSSERLDSDAQADRELDRKFFQEADTVSLYDNLAQEDVAVSDCPAEVLQRFPKLLVEGPTGSAMEDVFKFKVSLCFAGGIGITPFASVMSSLLKDEKLRNRMKLQRLHLIWACRDVRSFSWFTELVNKLQEQLRNDQRTDLLSVDLFLTGEASCVEAAKCPMSVNIRGCKLYRGRPEIDNILSNVARQSSRSTIGVFCCGPSSLISSVRKQCFHSTSATKAQFVFNKECF